MDLRYVMPLPLFFQKHTYTLRHQASAIAINEKLSQYGNCIGNIDDNAKAGKLENN